MGNLDPGFRTDRISLARLNLRIGCKCQHCVESVRFRVYTAFVKRNLSRKTLEKTTSRTTAKGSSDSTQSAQASEKFDAEQCWRALAARVRKLELELEIAKQDRVPSRKTQEPKEYRIRRLRRKPGPKTVSDAELDKRRDEIVRFLESFWPELEPLCSEVPKLKTLKRAFKAFASGPEAVTPWGPKVGQFPVGIIDNDKRAASRLLDSLSEVEAFLSEHQGRFAGNPRQLANALAGCPDIGFWASLKRCQNRPFQVGIHDRAMRSYIRRKHPRLYERLEAGISSPELASYWRGFRTKDRIMAGITAAHLERFWKAGTPLSSVRDIEKSLPAPSA